MSPRICDSLPLEEEEGVRVVTAWQVFVAVVAVVQAVLVASEVLCL